MSSSSAATYWLVKVCLREVGGNFIGFGMLINRFHVGVQKQGRAKAIYLFVFWGGETKNWESKVVSIRFRHCLSREWIRGCYSTPSLLQATFNGARRGLNSPPYGGQLS